MVLQQQASQARRMGIAVAAVVAALAAGYVGGLGSGAITLIGYESRTAEAHGIVADNSGLQSLFSGLPVVWLRQGSAIRADYDVDAEFGALELWVSTPLRMQSATANVAGKRKGSVLFVAQSAGFYSYRLDPTPIRGPRCHPPGTTMLQVIIGDSNCPTYKLRYKVTWRLATSADTAGAPAQIAIPAESEKSIYIPIGI
jgi:hypothetical protein